MGEFLEVTPTYVFGLKTADYCARPCLRVILLSNLPQWVNRFQHKHDQWSYEFADASDGARKVGNVYKMRPYRNALHDIDRDYLGVMHTARLLLADILSPYIGVRMDDDSPAYYLQRCASTQGLMNPAETPCTRDLESLVMTAVSRNVVDTTCDNELITIAATRLLLMSAHQFVLAAPILDHYSGKLHSDKAPACLLGTAEHFVQRRDALRDRDDQDLVSARTTLVAMFRKLGMDPSDRNLLRVLSVLAPTPQQFGPADRVLQLGLARLLESNISRVNRDNALYDLVLGDVAAGRLSDLRAKYAAVQATHPVVLNMYRRLFEDSRQLAYRAKELI